MQRFLMLATWVALFLPMTGWANPDADSLSLDEETFYQIYLDYVDSLESTFHYETGLITLGDDLATIRVPEGYQYLNPSDSRKVLEDIWGNPPHPEGNLGMLFPLAQQLSDDNTYGIEIKYMDDGHIDDDDAVDIDYDELLEILQEDVRLASDEREAAGYGTMALLGWASPPYYDQQAKKLHWAMELNFDEMPVNTLNYHIRILGREGYLNLNVIGDMTVLPDIKAGIDPILASVNFTPGNTYADYRPGVDRLAAYGVGGLIAGKVLAKAGILAKLGIFLAKAWKLILIGFAAVVAGLRKFLGNKA